MKKVIKHLFIFTCFICFLGVSHQDFLAAEPDTDSEVTHGKIVFYEDAKTTEFESSSKSKPKGTKASDNKIPSSTSTRISTKNSGALPQTSEKLTIGSTLVGSVMILLAIVGYQYKRRVRKL